MSILTSLAGAMIAQHVVISSEILGEDRAIEIVTPSSYGEEANADRSYPVVYLLDGEFLGGLGQGVIDFMMKTAPTPEVILVVIAGKDRIAELTPTHSLIGPKDVVDEAFSVSGGAEQFLDFLDQELIAHVESHWRTSEERYLVGFSLSALFSLFAAQEKPHLFAGVAAIDPSLWWDNAWLLKRLDQQLTNVEAMDGKQSIYLCASNTPGAENNKMPESAQAYVAKLNTKSDRFRTAYELLDGETHATIAVNGLYRGFRFLFSQQENE